MARVFETVRTNSPITRHEIAEVSGLSKPTVNEALDILLKRKLINMDKGSLTSISGKPGPKAQNISFNKDRKKIVGIDIGSSKIRVLLSDLDGNLIASRAEPTPHNGGRAATLSKVEDLVLQILREGAVKISQVGAMVAGSPGTINPTTGEITRAYNLPEWENFSLSDELSRLLKKDVHVENEAHLAIYGEHWKGGAKELGNAAAMSIGVGIGLGLLIDGQVYRGFNGIAGEVGNLPLEMAGSIQSPANANFEFQASAVGLERKFEKERKSRGAKEIIEAASNGIVTAQVIYSAAANGNSLGIALVKEQLNLLSRGIASVCCITNPEVFILGGGLAPALVPHLDSISKMVQEITLIAPKIMISELKDLATAYGALRRGIDIVDRATLTSILQETTP